MGHVNYNGYMVTDTAEKKLRMSLFDLEFGDFSLGTIANSLARQGRYLGHGQYYYSVAQHCWELSFFVPKGFEFVALMHDATEVFVGDVHSWIKTSMRENNEVTFDYLEDHVWGLLALKYDLPERLPDAVHTADKEIRQRECRHLFENKDEGITEWYPGEAAVMFLKRAFYLRPDLFKEGMWWEPIL